MRKKKSHWTGEQYSELWRLHASGSTEQDLANAYGITKYAMRTALLHAKHFVAPTPFDSLSVRTLNALKSANLTTVDSVREAFHARTLLSLPNIGRKALNEIREWLDVTV